jgi:stage II sporulation protein E
MRELISGIDSVNPRIIGEKILEAANEVCDFKPRDDMTVMVTKVWKTVR